MKVLKLLLSLLFPPRGAEHLVNTAGEDALFAKFAPTTFELSGAHAVGLLPYRDETVRAFILEAKFHDNTRAQEALSALLADFLMERAVEETAFGEKLALVPIPLGEKRHKERGYNQVERVCEMAIAELGTSVVLLSNALTRTRETLPQTNLSGDARRENIHDAFQAKEGLDPNFHYLVIDDVVTTGATLLSAITALKKGGAVKISAIALAH